MGLFPNKYEQFKYQNLAWSIQNFCRNYHILIGSSNINREKIIDINQITNELLGLNVEELLAVEIMILWLCSKNPDPLSAPETLYHRTETSVITKKTQESIMVSFYLLVMTFADGLYWLVRDYYRTNNLGQKFINAFGEMFEDYFEELYNGAFCTWIIIYSGSVDFQNLSPEYFFWGADVSDAGKQFVKVIAAAKSF